MPKRMILDFGPKTREEIEGMAASKEISKTEFVRRAVTIYLEISKQVAENPKRRVAIIEADRIVYNFIPF